MLQREATLWILAAILTLTSVAWQRLTGPTHRMRIRDEFAGVGVSARMLRTQTTGRDLPVRIQVEATRAEKLRTSVPNDAQVSRADSSSEDSIRGTSTTVGGMVAAASGSLIWRRFPTDEPWHRLPMNWTDGALTAAVPHQPPAGKVEYWTEIHFGDQTRRLPADTAVVARFKGSVPRLILVIHILAMFAGMLFAVRAGLEALARGAALRRQAWIALGLLAVGGLVFGPIVQKHAFGAYWTGWPLGEDLTDNKLAVAILAWALAVWRLRRYRPECPRGRWWAVAATVVVLAIYAIPHSMYGSTLDYATMEHVQG